MSRRRDNVRFVLALLVLGLLVLAAVLAHDSSLPPCLTEGCYR